MLTYDIDAGDLGPLVLEWDTAPLGWIEPDPSVGEPRGYFDGKPRFMGGTLGWLELSPADCVSALMDSYGPDHGTTAHRRHMTEQRIAAWADGLVEAMAAPERADEQEWAA